MRYSPVIWFLCLFVVLIGLENIYPLPFALSFSKIYGLLCLFFALIIVIWTKYLYMRHNTSYDPNKKPVVLITDSIYAISRNPIYIALVLAFFGVSLILSLSYSLPGTLSLYLILSRHIIPHEEKELEMIFKDRYLEYKSSTPKWV